MNIGTKITLSTVRKFGRLNILRLNIGLVHSLEKHDFEKQFYAKKHNDCYARFFNNAVENRRDELE